MIKILGDKRKEIVTTTRGYFDVTVQSGLVYATRQGRPHTVDVYDSSTWERLREIPTPCCSAEDYSLHTLQVTDDRILLCCSKEEKLRVLSHLGELLHTHGHPKRKAFVDSIGKIVPLFPVYGPGVLWRPRLCQVDLEGSALVADWANCRLQVMRSDGTWSVVSLDQTAVYPQAAIWFDASLYVACSGKITRFSTPSL